MSTNLSTPSITGLYKGVGSLTTSGEEKVSASNGPSFADVLLKEPAKNLLETSKTTEIAVQKAAAGQIDEQSLSEIVTEMDIALQSFKSVWEKSIQVLNELPRVSM